MVIIMELQIQDLVASIKKDGIDVANKEAQAIVSDAKKQASFIIAEAKEEAEKLKEQTQKDIELYKTSAQLSAQQAKRDAMLAFKKEIQNEFEKILLSDVRKTLNEKNLASLIAAALKDEDVSGYSVELSDVSETLKSQLAEEIKNGLEIKPSKAVQAGFKLADKNGSGYFDCSDEELTKMLLPFIREINL